VKSVCICVALLFGSSSLAQGAADEMAIRKILQQEVLSWNAGDADAYSRPFASDCTFTHILGMFFKGQKAFRDRHEEIFKRTFRGTELRQEVGSIQFIHPEIAIVETVTWVSGFRNGPPPGTRTDDKGRLRTRLLQVFVQSGGEWKIATYHNVDVKPTTVAPEPSGEAISGRTSH
jgi:uncharacterized protein (TIGR02246 family)